MEPGKNRWFPSSEKRPVGIQPSMRVPSRWSMGALHKDSKKGLKRTGQGASTRWRGAVNIHVRSGVNRKQQALDKGLRRRPRSWTPHAKSPSPPSVQPIFPSWNLRQGGHILQAQVEASPVLIGCILAQMVKGISANLAREAKMVQAAPKFSNRRYRTAHRYEVTKGLWPLACITSIKTNQRDRLVRSVTLKTKSRTLEWPVDTVVVLEGAAEVAEEA